MSDRPPAPVERRQRLRAWIPAIAIAAVIFGLSSIPGDRVPDVWVPSADKLVHAAVYAVLGAAIALGFHRVTRVSRAVWLVLASGALGTLYGVSDELHQLLTPNRSCELLDVVADAVGSLGGALAFIVVRGRWWPDGRGRRG